MNRSGSLLALDVGTQSTRAILFDAEGRLLGRQQVSVPPYLPGDPGVAEQHAATYWEALCQATRGLWTDADPGEVRAVSLTTQRATMVCCDADGTPLRPAVVWLDQRRAAHPPRLGVMWEGLLRLAGARDVLAHFQARAPCNWLAEREPDLWRATARYLQLSGWLTHRLTGRFRDATAAQVGYLPFDYKRHCWAKPSDIKWRALRVRPEQLPELLPPGEHVGMLTGRAAEALGLPPGVPMIAAGADKACEVLGSGATDPQTAQLSFGTSATLNTTQARYVEVERLLPAYPAAMPGAYNTEVQVSRGFWMVSWFKREFAHAEVVRAEAEGTKAEVLLDALLAEAPAGAMGLTLQPYWSPGVRNPGPEAKGAIIGFGDVHTRAHVYRAIIEGLCYALRAGREQVERRTRQRMTRLIVSGGGAQSDQAMQIAAEVFGLPAERPDTTETSALGAAITAAVGLGWYRDAPEAAAAMTRIGRRFDPDPRHVATYDALYRQVYRPLYGRLRPLYQAIRRITRYPAD